MSLKIGDEVIIDPQKDHTGRFTGVVWKIEKTPARKNEVNYVLRESDGDRRLKTRGENLVPRQNGVFLGPLAAAEVTLVPFEPWLQPGTVVRKDGQGAKLFVIVASSVRNDGGRVYRLFPLGGSDRYWRSVPQRQLTVVDAGKIRVEE